MPISSDSMTRIEYSPPSTFASPAAAIQPALPPPTTTMCIRGWSVISDATVSRFGSNNIAPCRRERKNDGRQQLLVAPSRQRRKMLLRFQLGAPSRHRRKMLLRFQLVAPSRDRRKMLLHFAGQEPKYLGSHGWPREAGMSAIGQP